MLKFTAPIFAAVVLVACGTTATDGAATAVDGEPWRQLVNEYQVGGPFDLGIHAVTNADDFEQLWVLLGRDGEQPDVDFAGGISRSLKTVGGLVTKVYARVTAQGALRLRPTAG